MRNLDESGNGKPGSICTALDKALAATEYVNKHLARAAESSSPAHASRSQLTARKARCITAEPIVAYTAPAGLKGVKGTQQIRSVTFSSAGVMRKANLSCCCPSCMHGVGVCRNLAYVGQWEEVQLRWSRGRAASIVEGEELEEGDVERDAAQQGGGMGELVLALQAGDWVAVSAEALTDGTPSTAYALVRLEKRAKVAGQGRPRLVNATGYPAQRGAVVFKGRPVLVLESVTAGEDSMVRVALGRLDLQWFDASCVLKAGVEVVGSTLPVAVRARAAGDEARPQRRKTAAGAGAGAAAIDCLAVTAETHHAILESNDVVEFN